MLVQDVLPAQHTLSMVRSQPRLVLVPALLVVVLVLLLVRLLLTRHTICPVPWKNVVKYD